MKKGIIIIAVVFLLLIGYRVYLWIRPEPVVDESVVSEIHDLLVDNGYDIIAGDGFASYNAIKDFHYMTPLDEELEIHDYNLYPEYFEVYIFIYKTENDAIIKTGQFSPKGDVYLGDNGSYSHNGYHTAPRFYRVRNAIVLFIGVDPAVQGLLEAHCGDPFAG